MPAPIALYGGSFDPVHMGHLLLAREAMELVGASRVVFVPAHISPHKLQRPPSPPEVRVEMLRAAVAGEPGFEVDDRELRSGGPSYAIETASAYRAGFPDSPLCFLIGEDNVAELDTWREIDRLKALVEFVVLARPGHTPSGTYRRVRRLIEINSTEVRTRVARGLSIRYMTPMAVCDIIRRRSLYA